MYKLSNQIQKPNTLHLILDGVDELKGDYLSFFFFYTINCPIQTNKKRKKKEGKNKRYFLNLPISNALYNCWHSLVYSH